MVNPRKEVGSGKRFCFLFEISKSQKCFQNFLPNLTTILALPLDPAYYDRQGLKIKKYNLYFLFRFCICLLLHSRVVPYKSEVTSSWISINGGKDILPPSTFPRRLGNLLATIANGSGWNTNCYKWIPYFTFAKYSQERVAQHH